MAERSRNSPIRFLLAGGLAVLLAGTAVLAPRWVRNRQFEQQVFRQQQELVELVSLIEQRQELIVRIEQDPALLAMLTAQSQQTAAEYVTMPDVLAISPDLLPGLEKSAEMFPSASAGADLPPPPETWPQPIWEFLEHIAGQPRWRQTLFALAGGLLLIGCFPRISSPYTRLTAGSRRLWQLCTARYRMHPPQETLSGPHARSASALPLPQQKTAEMNPAARNKTPS